MANIERRLGAAGKVTYRARVRVRGQIRTASFSRKTDAHDWARDVESALKRGRYVPDSKALRRTVGDMVDRYEDELPSKPRNRDARNVAQQLRWWKQQIGRISLADCPPAVIIEQRDKLARGAGGSGKVRAPSTVNRYLAALSHAFTTAQKEWQWIEDNPLRNVSKKEEPRGRVRFLDDAERERLLKACKESEYDALYPVVVLALSTGARKMEIFSLSWDQVDLKRGRIVLTMRSRLLTG